MPNTKYAVMNQAAEELFQILQSFQQNITMFDAGGNKTSNPDEARNFYLDGLGMVIMIQQNTRLKNTMRVNIGKDISPVDIKDLLGRIRSLANKYMIQYIVKTFGKTIEPKDFSFMTKQRVSESRRATYNNPRVEKRYHELRTLPKAELVKIYQRSHRVSDATELRRMTKSWLVSDILRDEFGEKRMNEAKVNVDWDGPQTATVKNYTNDVIELVSDTGEEIEIYSFEPDFAEVMAQIQAQEEHAEWREKQYLDRANRQVDRYRAMRESAPIMQGSPEHLRKLQAKLKKSKPGSPEHSQIKHAIEAMFGKEHIVEAKNDKSGKKWPGYRAAGFKSTQQVYEGFSGWHGSAHKSMNELNNARIVVNHRRSVDEMKRGARTRQIESIFIENNHGERFRFPSNNVTAAKAMVRHVNEGGTPFDDFGQYIYETMEELNQLKSFARQDRKANFFESTKIQEEITGRIQSLRTTLGQISGPKGYAHHFESYSRETLDEGQLDEISGIAASFGPTLESTIPYVARVVNNMKVREGREAQIKGFAKAVMNNQIMTTEQIDRDHPEQPGLAFYESGLAESQAWAAWLSERVEDESLAESLKVIAEHATSLGSDYQRIAEHAIRAILETAKMVEADEQETSNPASEALDSITESIESHSWQNALGVK